MSEKKRVIITVVGKDGLGIVAAVSKALAEHKLNILDISQTLVQDFFTMIILADSSQSKDSLQDIKESLESLGQSIGMQITCQHEDIFQYMHRI